MGNRPTIQTSGSIGADLVSTEAYTIYPGKSQVISTGYVYDIPVGAFVRGRSSLAFKYGLVAFEGTIDTDYKGEVKVLMFNHGEDICRIEVGERVAQLVVLQTYTEMHYDTKAGIRRGGFGSTNG